MDTRLTVRNRANGVVQRVWDMLWRRAEISHGSYMVLGATVSLALSAVAVAAYWLVFTALLELGTPPTSHDDTPPVLELLFGYTLFAPLSETLIVAFLVGVARAFTGLEVWHVVAGALPLGLLHGVQGMFVYDAGGHAFVSVVSFVIFAIVYVVWRRESFKEAYWMCAGVHAIHNTVGTVALLAEGAWSGGATG